MIPMTVVAGPPAPVDFVEAFKHKLSLFGINMLALSHVCSIFILSTCS